MKLIETFALKKVFQTGSEVLTVFQGVEFSLAAGTTLVVSGESGSGKSTLLNLIGGLDTASAGSILFQGWNIIQASEEELTAYRSKEIGFIFQFHYLLKDFTALENVLLPALIIGTARSAALPRAKRLLDQVGLEGRMKHFPAQLSGGERQRVAVARALMNDPHLILADEPTGNLDERNSEEVKDLLFGLVKDYGKTMILVTHDYGLAAAGDRKFHLEHGIFSEI